MLSIQNEMENKVYRDIVDFDMHLEDPSLDFRN